MPTKIIAPNTKTYRLGMNEEIAWAMGGNDRDIIRRNARACYPTATSVAIVARSGAHLETMGAATSPVTASTHPAPSTMARERLGRESLSEYGPHYMLGVQDERTRMAAWLREQWTTGEDGARSRNVGQRLADELEGKAQSSTRSAAGCPGVDP